jgi:BMFP domain-containing protein YqiC
MERETVIRQIIQRITQTLQGVLPGTPPERVLTSLQDVLTSALAGIELVPRRELEGHLDALRGLRARVEQLESRVRSLEQTDLPPGANTQAGSDNVHSV